MTNKYCDSPIHKCLCLSLALIFIFTIVLSVPAAADSVRPNEPVGWQDGDTFRDILLAVLDSWGISFSKSDPDDDTSILEYSDMLMQEFYDANQTTQELFWDAVKFGASETGNIILDFLGVNKIRQFANWLKNKYSLTDNSSASTAPSQASYYINGYPCYILPNTASEVGYNQFYGASRTAYIFYLSENSQGTVLTRVVFSPGTSSFTFYERGNNLRITANSVTPNQQYAYRSSSSNMSVLPSGVSLIPYGPSVLDILVGPVTSSPFINLTIVTQVIEIPSEDIDPEDGLQIEVPGTNWGDSIYTILNIIERLIGLYDSTQLNINTVIDLISTLLQGLQKSVSVDNIPGAVVLDYDEYDIPLETEWSLVDGFFSEETEGSPFSTLTTILYGFPEPFVLFFSVIVVFVVAYGFIRLGRDSH